MKIKTSDLTGAALCWAVASIEYPKDSLVKLPTDPEIVRHCYPYATCWNDAGQIIERETINLVYRHPSFTGLWTAFTDEWDDDKNGVNCGPTPLIAAMRCYVASKLGDEVEIPEVLA